MIRHIVFFNAADRDSLEMIQVGLSILTEIPHARRLEIGANLKSDQLCNDIDFVVYGEFDDEAALAAFKAHPLYEASIKLVRPLRQLRIAVDYEAGYALTRPLLGVLSATATLVDSQKTQAESLD